MTWEDDFTPEFRMSFKLMRSPLGYANQRNGEWEHSSRVCWRVRIELRKESGHSIVQDGAIRYVQETVSTVISILIGFGVLALSPRLVGTPLPWDADWPFYSTILLGAGVLVSLLSIKPWLGFFGIWAGQITALLVLPLDRTANMLGTTVWWVLGVGSTGVGALILVVGWHLGETIHRRINKRA